MRTKTYADEPLAYNAGLVALGTVVVQIAAMLGFDLTPEQLAAMSTFVTSAGALIVVFTTRGKVTPEKHLAQVYGPGVCDGDLYGDHEDCEDCEQDY